MKHTHEFTVKNKDGTALKYTTSHYPAKTGLRLFTRLVALMGEPISAVAAEALKSDGKQKGSAIRRLLDSDFNPEMIPKAVQSLLAKFHEDVVESLVTDLLRTTQAGKSDLGDEAVFNLHFAGQMGLMFKVLKEVVAFQFGDFFGDLAASAAAEATSSMTSSESTSPTTSPGPSGGSG